MSIYHSVIISGMWRLGCGYCRATWRCYCRAAHTCNIPYTHPFRLQASVRNWQNPSRLLQLMMTRSAHKFIQEMVYLQQNRQANHKMCLKAMWTLSDAGFIRVSFSGRNRHKFLRVCVLRWLPACAWWIQYIWVLIGWRPWLLGVWAGGLCY